MENAVKALYIAAGVLLGVMILSLAVVLYSNLQSYIENTNNQIEFNELTRFNTNYSKYIGQDVTIQDIVTIASMAYENNMSYNTNPEEWTISDNSLYIQIDLDGSRIDNSIENDNGGMLELLERNSNSTTTYRCTENNVEYSTNTGRIIHMNFTE